MPTNILMPALSPTMTEGTLVKWNVAEGDQVKAGDVIAEIETDKATMEVEAVDDGTVGRIVVAEGTEGVQVNSVIAVLVGEGESGDAEDGADAEDEADDAEAAGAAPKGGREPQEDRADRAGKEPQRRGAAEGDDDGRAAAQASPLAARMAEIAGIDLGAVTGSGPGGKIVKADVEAASGSASRAAPRKANGDGRVFASPLARRMAAEAGIDLSDLAGSGPGGRIVKSDIEDARKRGTAKPAAEKPAAEAPAGAAKQPGAMPGMPEFDLVPLSGMRKVIARRLTESKQTIPHFYMTVDCAVDELVRVRAALNQRAPEGVKLSINDLIIKAVALALRRVPDANASWTDEGIRRWKSVDVAVAVAIPQGLITPIIRGADEKGLARISAEMKDLAKRARDGKLKPEEFQGGTFSISNMGMYGIRQFDAVINPPQACILAIGASEQRAVVKDGALAVATMMTCTLSCDHRVVDGALGAQWLAAFKGLIEFPAAMLL
ncbi:MAG: 2-oxo acid dehydrogenase subunit E2 [Alphaproteobacteria bacterium]